MKMDELTTYENEQASLNHFPHIKREPIRIIAVTILSCIIGRSGEKNKSKKIIIRLPFFILCSHIR